MIEKEKLAKLYKKWGTMIEVSRRVEWSYDAVRYWMNKYKISKNPRRVLCYYAYWRQLRGEEPPRISVGQIRVTINKIKHLYYQKGYGAKEVGKRIGWSQDMVYSFMRANNLKRRSSAETNKITFVNQAPSFNLKKNLTFEEEKLKIAGIMLYWAEGGKEVCFPGRASKMTIDFANSDSEMIKIFLNFLRKICGINESRLRVLLYCYANQDIDTLKRYWCKVTNISSRQFIKPYIRQDFNTKKIGRMKYGLVHIRYHDKKLFLQIQDWIKEYLNKNLQG